jgi:organic hydroperoxide reductase OsmC/OhrA
MSNHSAVIQWQRKSAIFTDGQYSRAHEWSFDGGTSVQASSSPHVVKIPFSDPTCVDPEEGFIASLSSCHMLFFLGLASKAGYLVDCYTDSAEGHMSKNELGKIALTSVTLRPKVIFSGTKQMSESAFQGLHHEAHESCFLASSVTTEIIMEGSWQQGLHPNI